MCRLLFGKWTSGSRTHCTGLDHLPCCFRMLSKAKFAWLLYLRHADATRRARLWVGRVSLLRPCPPPHLMTFTCIHSVIHVHKNTSPPQSVERRKRRSPTGSIGCTDEGVHQHASLPVPARTNMCIYVYERSVLTEFYSFR